MKTYVISPLTVIALLVLVALLCAGGAALLEVW